MPGSRLYEGFLLPSVEANGGKPERIVRLGMTWKRKGLFSKYRALVLTDAPRLLYFEPPAPNASPPPQSPFRRGAPWREARAPAQSQEEQRGSMGVPGAANHSFGCGLGRH